MSNPFSPPNPGELPGIPPNLVYKAGGSEIPPEPPKHPPLEVVEAEPPPQRPPSEVPSGVNYEQYLKARAETRARFSEQTTEITVSQDRFAERFASEYSGTYAYQPHKGQWWVYDKGLGWEQRDRNLVPMARIVRQVVDEVHHLTTEEPNLKSLAKQRSQWGRTNHFEGALKIAREMMEVPTDLWNIEPDLLGHPGGLVTDLKTGKQRTQEKSDYVSLRTGVVPADDGSVFGDFVLELLVHPSRVARLRWLLKQSLFGRQNHKVVICHGRPGTGKSTALGCIRAALGDYGYALPSKVLMKRRHEAHPEELANLHGKRFCLSSETPEGAEFDASKVSSITGGDAITARFMRQNSFQFDPVFDLYLICNEMPEVPKNMHGLKRRIETIEFDVPVHLANDKSVQQYWLSPEGQSVALRWVLDCPEGEPKIHVTDWENTDGYLKGPVNPVDEWLSGYEVVKVDQHYFTTNEAYEDFKSWWTGDTITMQTFAKDLNYLLRDYKSHKKSFKINGKTVRGWHGITMVHAVHNPPVTAVTPLPLESPTRARVRAEPDSAVTAVTRPTEEEWKEAGFRRSLADLING